MWQICEAKTVTNAKDTVARGHKVTLNYFQVSQKGSTALIPATRSLPFAVCVLRFAWYTRRRTNEMNWTVSAYVAPASKKS